MNAKNSSNSTKQENRRYASIRNYVALGEYLQEMRIRADLTQKDVSESLGYSSAQFISNFERGMSAPPLKKLKHLIAMYKMPVERVMALILEGEREFLRIALRADPRKEKPSRKRH